MSRLAKAVEVDRLIGGTALPRDEILRALRPQLRGTGSPTRRVPTPQRLFCRPFEDLLVSGERKAKQKGRIARSSVDAVWNWLARELMPARHHKLTASLREAVLADEEDQIERDLNALRSESAAALNAALADEVQRSVAAEKLGGAAVVEDAAEMTLMLAQAQTVAELQRRLPKPVAQLTQDDVWFLCDLIDRVAAGTPDFAPYVALVVLGRLERPWEVLRLVAAISRKSTDVAISGTDMDVVGELLFSDLDEYAANIQSARPVNFDPDKVLASLAGFTELSSGMIKELGIRRDGKWGQRLAKDRAAVAQIMENLLQRALKEILAALPSHRGFAFAKRQRGLDLSRPIDPDRLARATRYAQLIAYSRPFAVAGAFSARLMKVTDETALALRTHAEDILTELRATAPEARLRAGEHLAVMLSLCELVLGEGETDFLRRPRACPQPDPSVFRRNTCARFARSRRLGGFMPYRSHTRSAWPMPNKKNPLKLNPLQLRTLTLMQALARIPEAATDGPEPGEITINRFPRAHADHFHLGDAVVMGTDATGLFNEAVWHALDRKGLARADWPKALTLTAAGLAYDTGDAREILRDSGH